MIEVVGKICDKFWPVTEYHDSIRRFTRDFKEIVSVVLEPKVIYSFILTALGVPKDITIANPNVVEVLAINSKLREFLVQEAYSKIKEFFPDSQLILDYYKDPESESYTLMVYIQVSMSPEEAFNALKKFDEEWWLDKAPKYKNLCIHLRLV